MANEDINCGSGNVCNTPKWKTDREYAASPEKITTGPLKDTILIPAGGYAVVYFKSDNPGWWFLHCHIEVHQLEGMGVIINEGTYSDKTPAPYTMNKCGNFSFTVEDYNKAIENNLNPTASSSSVNFYAATIGLGVVALLFLVIIITMGIVIACICCF